MNIEQRASIAGTEYRTVAIDGAEVRADDERGDITFEGVASVVDTPYAVRDAFGTFEETVTADAINYALRDKGDIAMYINHRWDDVPLATRNSDTLLLRATPHLGVTALWDRARDDVTRARSAVNRRQMNQMSIGFVVPDVKGAQAWTEDFSERTIHKLVLKEVSLVKDGANPYTSASVRTVSDLIETLDDPEEIRRAIAALEQRLLPGPVVQQNDFDASTYVVLRQQLWAKKLVA